MDFQQYLLRRKDDRIHLANFIMSMVKYLLVEDTK